jgi:hypothetical protein
MSHGGKMESSQILEQIRILEQLNHVTELLLSLSAEQVFQLPEEFVYIWGCDRAEATAELSEYDETELHALAERIKEIKG